MSVVDVLVLDGGMPSRRAGQLVTDLLADVERQAEGAAGRSRGIGPVRGGHRPG
jgi:hypothetical protein